MRLALLHLARQPVVRSGRIALQVAGAALATSCAGIEPAPPPASSLLTIENLIGDAACDVDAQCGTVAVGAKTCGGPRAYLAWSSKRTDGSELQRAAGEQARAAKAEAEAKGIMSDCSFVADPGAVCAGPAAVVASPSSPASPLRRCRLRADGRAGKIF